MMVIGHRGACGHEPENTLRSFRRAMELGVHGVELDVYAMAGELIVIHDDTLDRTTNGRGRLSLHTFDALRRLDAGKGEPIPLLREVLDLVNRKVWVNIELKGPNTAVPTCQVISDYTAYHGWLLNDFLVSSFNHQELQKVKILLPEVPIGVLFSRWQPNMVGRSKKLQACSIHPSLRQVNPSLVKDAHLQGMKVFVYTVNTPEDMARMKALGVDGIFTNYPDRALQD